MAHQETFTYLNPQYPVNGSSSISLILGGGNIVASFDEDTHNALVDTSSISSSVFSLAGIGFRIEEPYKDTLYSCEQVWIPFEGSEGEYTKFLVGARSVYNTWIYLWSTGSTEEQVKVSGSWVFGNFAVADDEPYDKVSASVSSPDYLESLDYTCCVPGPGNIVFVSYVPDGFEAHGDYNATLNNAIHDSQEEIFFVSGSGDYIQKIKYYIHDYHKIPAIGGTHAGELVVGQEVSKVQEQDDFFNQFRSRASMESGSITLQTLDLAFTSYRAISASVYVDRFTQGTESAQIETIWEDLQHGNVDDYETIYFASTAELKTTGSWTGANLNTAVPLNSGSTVVRSLRPTIPVIGTILFTVQNNLAVRYTNATVYAPFMNTVYRTDKFGVVEEVYPPQTGSAV